MKPKRVAELAQTELDEMARRVRYVGSIEHKTYPSPAGEPRPRHDASKCPRLAPERWAELSDALRAAVRAGYVSEAVDPGGLPRYVWGKLDGALYEARHLSTPGDGYKAYPVEEFELPESLRAALGGA